MVSLRLGESISKLDLYTLLMWATSILAKVEDGEQHKGRAIDLDPEFERSNTNNIIPHHFLASPPPHLCARRKAAMSTWLIVILARAHAIYPWSIIAVTASTSSKLPKKRLPHPVAEMEPRPRISLAFQSSLEE